jgi:hypothetical protein
LLLFGGKPLITAQSKKKNTSHQEENKILHARALERGGGGMKVEFGLVLELTDPIHFIGSLFKV